MKAKIILVCPEYPENIGLVARVMKNFGFGKLLIVKPQTDFLGAQAKSRAMHAQDVLQKARVFDSFEKALEQVDYAVATTAKTGSGKKMFRAPVSPKNLAETFAKTNAVLGIVFGREGNGLTNDEIRKCDFVATIPASKNYHTLNISHAAAVILYELYSAEKKLELKTASRKTKRTALKKIEGLVNASKTIQNRKSVMLAFKALVGRSLITEKEARALLALLSELERKD